MCPTDRAFQKYNRVLDLYAFYQTCKQLLIGGLNSPHFKDLLRWYQKQIFSTGQVAEVITIQPALQDYGHITKDYLQQLQAAIPVPPGNAVAGLSSSSPMAHLASLAVQHVSVTPLIPEPPHAGSKSGLNLNSDLNSNLDSDLDSDLDLDSGSRSSSGLSDDKGVGRTDGKEPYRNTGEIHLCSPLTQC